MRLQNCSYNQFTTLSLHVFMYVKQDMLMFQQRKIVTMKQTLRKTYLRESKSPEFDKCVLFVIQYGQGQKFL